MFVKRSILLCQSAKLQSLQKITVPVAAFREQHTSADEYPVMMHNFKWPYGDLGVHKPTILWNLTSTVTCFVVGWWGKTILTKLNTTKFNNLSVLNEAMFKRPKGVPLITVSNHESCIDDPCLIGALMTNKELTQQSKMRWALGAHDVCYKKPWHGRVMSLGKTIPVVRGMGVYQRAVDFAVDRLNHGDWLHIFPEGRVNMERENLYRLKWGIGRIIHDLNTPPIVIPFWHVGMQSVLPNHRPYYTRAGKKILINVGNPIDLTNILKTIEDKRVVEKRKLITDVIQLEMTKLRTETLEMAKNYCIE